MFSAPLHQRVHALIRNGLLVQPHQPMAATAVQERVKPQQVAVVALVDQGKVLSHCLLFFSSRASSFFGECAD